MNRGHLSFPSDRQYLEDGVSFTFCEFGLTIEMDDEQACGSYNQAVELSAHLDLSEIKQLYEWLGSMLKSETC